MPSNNQREYRSPPAQPPSTAPSLSPLSSPASPPLNIPNIPITSPTANHSHTFSGSSFSQSHHEEDLSTTHSHDDPDAEIDSLLDASAEEVELRAQYLLSDDYLHSQKHDGVDDPEIEPIDPFEVDLPRRIPSSKSLEEDQRRDAERFLRKCVEEVDEEDWRYKTPKVFASPGRMGLGEKGRGEGEERDGLDEDWLDTKFNPLSFGRPITALGVGIEELDLRRDDRFGDELIDGDWSRRGIVEGVEGMVMH